jgi:hypothetical protein
MFAWVKGARQGGAPVIPRWRRKRECATGEAGIGARPGAEIERSNPGRRRAFRVTDLAVCGAFQDNGAAPMAIRNCRNPSNSAIFTAL